MGKLPAIQFYPADWRKDPGVQSLSRHDRSVWFDIICIMHESDERGVLLLAGKPMPDEALGQLLGLDNQTLNQTLSKLEAYGVASRRVEDGALFNRRMVKDEVLRKVRSECGKQGGNPNLLNQNSTNPVKQNPTPSSSSSFTTTSSIQKQKISEPMASQIVPDDGKHPDLLIYEQYPRKEARASALKAVSKAVARLVKGEQGNLPLSKRDAQAKLYKAVVAYARSPAGRNPDVQFIPHAATWFNQGRYDDDPKMWQVTGGNNERTDALTEGFDAIAAYARRTGTAATDGDDAGLLSAYEAEGTNSGGLDRGLETNRGDLWDDHFQGSTLEGAS